MPGRQHQAAPCISRRPHALKIQRLATVEGPDGRRTPLLPPHNPSLSEGVRGGGGGTDTTSQDVTNHHHLAFCVPALRFAQRGSRGGDIRRLKRKRRQTTARARKRRETLSAPGTTRQSNATRRNLRPVFGHTLVQTHSGIDVSV